MQSLFPVQQGSGNGGTTLIKFKAGRCNMAEIPNAGGKMKITPQKQKGMFVKLMLILIFNR